MTNYISVSFDDALDSIPNDWVVGILSINQINFLFSRYLNQTCLFHLLFVEFGCSYFRFSIDSDHFCCSDFCHDLLQILHFAANPYYFIFGDSKLRECEVFLRIGRAEIVLVQKVWKGLFAIHKIAILLYYFHCFCFGYVFFDIVSGHN